MMDGDRFLTQSDHARSLSSPEQVQAYVDQIKAITPHYLQQKYIAAARQRLEKQQAEVEVISPPISPTIELRMDKRS
jgi:hypothetical protein